ncbi:MAG: T9SS type A sorting domain-containing protein, partial [Bacteroidetes bacterium]
QTITAGLNEQYWALSFRNINYGMIACGGGKILKTSDGGNIWTQVQAGDIRALYTIDMIDSLHIAAAGAYGKNVYSSDGGFSWNSNPDIPASSATNCIDFIDTDTGYSVQDITNIKKTTNKGQNWFTPIPNGLEQICEWHIQILNDGCGYACGEEIGGFYALNFYKRTNWLDNWSRLFLNDNFYDVHFLNETTGFALSGSLHKTTDRGITWKRDTTAPGGTDILFIDSVTGFIAGSKIYKTTNKGEIWYQTNSLGLAAGKVFFITKQIGWALSGRNILKTTDAGENWFLQFQQIGYDSYTSIYFIDSLYGWATSRYIWQTTNGGINWVERTDIPAFMCEDIYFIGQNGFIIDEYQKLYKSTNSGNNWFVQINSPGLIKNFGWLSDKHGFIMGYSVVFETIDSGATWHLVNELNNIGLQKFHSPKTYIGYSIGSAGLIYRYFDSALIPVELITFNGEYNNSYILLNWKTSSEINNRGFEILKSSNTKNWEVIGFINGQGTTIKLNNYYFIDKNIVSEKNYYRLKQIDLDGAYKYSNIIEVRTQIENLNLSQNFPNPFNSMTNIEFSIPKKAFIKLSLYDVKGEKINELINEEKERGYYSIIINNKDLSTGIYFYRLSTSSGFSITKKLTIIK